MYPHRGKRESKTLITDPLPGKATQHNVLASILEGSSNARGLECLPERPQVVRVEHTGEPLVEDFRVVAGENERLISSVFCKDLSQGATFKFDISVLPGDEASGSRVCDGSDLGYLRTIVGNFDLLVCCEGDDGLGGGVISSDLDRTIENDDTGAPLAGVGTDLAAINVEVRAQDSDLDVAHFDNERPIPVGSHLENGFARFELDGALLRRYHRAHVRVGIEVDGAAVRKGDQFVVAGWCAVGEGDDRLRVSIQSQVMPCRAY